MKSATLTSLLAKAEVTYGVDPGPTTVADGILAYDVKLAPMEGQEAERKRTLGHFSAAQKFPTGLFQQLTFETEMVGHATRGTMPAWGNLAAAAGMAVVASAGVSVTLTPKSTGLGSSTLYVNFDGVLHKLRGARGDCTIKASMHGLPRLAWRFIGLYEDPTDTAIVLPTLIAWQDPMPSNFINTPTFTINGFAAKGRSFELAFNTSLSYRELWNAQSVEINEREPMISTQIEAESMATLNPYLLARNQTSFAINLVHGLGSGKIATIAAPNCRLMRPEGMTEVDKRLDWPLKITPLPTVGNDDFSIVLT
jgi:hypothetical protein